FSFRDDFGGWDPRNQRPELWNLYNGRIRRGEHVRVFPLSNWTELDVWQYILTERLDVPPMYLAHEREVFRRDGMLYAVSEHVEQASRRRNGNGAIDLSLLTDGLRAEREQGITIDVAYRYFATARRRFILADTPGHVQYTRNMVTGASTAEAAIVLVDARKGVLEQTKRH